MRPRPVPVWALLVLLALVPTVGMGVFAVREANESAETARRARLVADDATQAVHLMELVFAITHEQVPTQGIVHAAALGVPTELASDVLGYDFVRRRAIARARTDAVLADLPQPLLEEFPQLARLGDGLADIRRRADADDASPQEIYEVFQRLARLVEMAAEEELSNLTTANGAAVDPAVSASIQGFSAGVALFRASQQQGVALADVLLAPDDLDARLALAYSVADYRRQVEEIERQTDPTVARAWEEIAGSMEIDRLDLAIAAAQTDPVGLAESGPIRQAEIFTDAFARIDLMAGLNRVSGRSAISAARAVEDRASEHHRRTLLFSVGVGFLSLLLAGVISVSISRPLRQLARRAGMVTDGRSGGAVALTAGPREVQIVAGALEEAAGSLRRVEKQAQALAAGELDDPVLVRPVPGVLGESVHASVEQLSRSLRDQEELRGRLAHQAHHDRLTGLLNRAGFLEAADEALAAARRAGRQIVLLFVDLDGFKRVNDNHGHNLGDEVLRTTAGRLVVTVASGDTVVRLGGDEFVIITPSIDGLESGVALGERLVEALAEPIVIGGRTAQVGASVGVARSTAAHGSGLDLLKEADQAVHRAKRGGGGRVDAFDETFRRERAQRLEIEETLRTGIPNGELELLYQPVIDARSRTLQGFEALARWRRPGHGLLSPVDFIPVAETSDLVIDVGRWVLLEATAQLAAWSADPALGSAHISVNISGRHLLDASIVDDVHRALTVSGLDPSRLVVEITETVVLSDLGVAVRHLRALRALGVRIALDDFGTGYTSIGQLGQLPIDILKIDREFVSGLGQQPQRSIVELMVEVAHTLGLGLVAEGVEDAGQLQALQRLSCDDVQGYLIARPLLAIDAASWSAFDPGAAPVTLPSPAAASASSLIDLESPVPAGIPASAAPPVGS
jgi:diguanylate cyclase (GGDEF)-like protein